MAWEKPQETERFVHFTQLRNDRMSAFSTGWVHVQRRIDFLRHVLLGVWNSRHLREFVVCLNYVQAELYDLEEKGCDTS